MQLKAARRWTLIVVVCGVGSCSETAAHASVGSVLGYPFRWLGGQFFGGGVDKLKGATDKTLASLDATVTLHEARVEGIAARLLSDAKGKVDDSVAQLDHGLEARILQIKTGADDSVTRAMGQVDTTLKRNIARLEGTGTRLIANTGAELRRSIDHFDERLRQRSADIERIGHDLLGHADNVLEARISQLDELASRQLGNVDVIATKQRIALEKSAIQVITIAGVIVFVVFALKRMFHAYSELKNTNELKRARGAARTALLARRLGPTLAGPIMAALAGVLVLFALYNWLPLGAAREARELTQLHQRELAASAARFDYAGARFHASHIVYLDPQQAALATARAEKVGLLRDLAYRPTLLVARNSVLAFEQRVNAVASLLGPGPDPDILVMRALIRWQTGATRADEHVAASQAARALRLAPRGFALAPLARSCIATFLDAPHVPESAGLGRDSAPLDELRAALADTPLDPGPSPFSSAVELSRMMRDLERTSNAHYVAMIEAHAAALAWSRSHLQRDARLVELLALRTQHAKSISDAWTAFDTQLTNTPQLNGPLVLDVFHLNDAVLTRARWLLAEPDRLLTPGRLEELPSTAASLGLRLELAPARVAWARRYDALLAGPLRQVVEFEETERFRTWERWCIEFEQAMVARASAPSPDEETAARWRLVVASSALALYIDSKDGRIAYARSVGQGLSKLPPAALLIQTPDAPQTLELALLQRGRKLI
jgi:hypothetical protein